LPCSLYTDRASHYFHTPRAGGKVDRAHLTQVGRALDRLGVEHIAACSRQARGRSKQMFATLQDRLLLKLAGITDISAANRFIAERYLPAHTARFAKPPEIADNVFVAIEPALLAEHLCIEQERVVAADNTISYGRRRLQLPQNPLRRH